MLFVFGYKITSAFYLMSAIASTLVKDTFSMEEDRSIPVYVHSTINHKQNKSMLYPNESQSN